MDKLARPSADEMEKRLTRFEDLLKFGQLINSSVDYKNIQKKAVSKIKKILACEQAVIFRINTSRNELYNRGVDDSAEGFSEIRFGIDERTFVGSCAHYRAILHIRDVQSDIRYRREYDHLNMFNCRNMLLIPLVSSGEIFGVLQTVNFASEEFSEEDIKFAEEIGQKLTSVISHISLFEKLNNQFIQIVEALADATLKRDRYTGGHTRRVVLFSEMIAKELSLSFQEMQDLRLSAVLHDMGKIGIEDKILKKKTQLSEQEFEVMKRHPHIGYEILGHISGLSRVMEGIRYHHERPDGQGYPYGLKGGEIPLLAQIISVADTFDAMISHRPYRKGLPPMVAYKEILSCKGTQFTDLVVEAFDQAFRKTHMYVPATLNEEELAPFKKAS